MPVNNFPSFDYQSLFNLYFTSEGIPFSLKNRSIAFPDDMTNPIYEKKYISINTPWTVLSHNLYGTIDFWWVLSMLNKSSIFYAEEGSEIYIISKKYLADIVETIKDQAKSV